MKRIKIVCSLIVSIICCILFSSRVYAASTYTTKAVSSFDKNVKVTLRGDGVVNQSGWARSNTGQYSIYYKHSANYFALCTIFARENPNTSYNCSAETSGWSKDNAVASGVAAIILQSSGGINSNMSMVEYFNAELAINKYLTTTKYGKSSNKVGYNGSNLSKIKSLKNTGIKSEKAYNDFKNKTMNIKLSPIKCDGNTCSTKVSYSGVKNSSTSYDSVSLPDNPKITVTGGTYNYNKSTGVITIARDSSGTALKVKVSSTVTRKYYVAQNYNCGNNQSVTLNKVVAKTQTRTISTSKNLGGNSQGSGGSASNDSCDFMLYKVNSQGEPLAGSSFYLKENVSSKANFKDFTDNGGDDPILNEEILNGACITMNRDSNGQPVASEIPYLEKTAPSGYKLNTQASAVPAAQVSVGGEYNITNIPDTSLIVYKKDGDTGKKVAGAKLVLYQGSKIVKWAKTGATENGNAIAKVTEYVDVSDYSNEQLAALLNQEGVSWTTDSGGMKFIELEYGTYTVEELSAPSNYIINDEVKPVTLSIGNGQNKTVEVVDYPSSVTFSKQDITTKKELPGAKLKIIDGQGNVYDEWTSTTKPHVINNLADGTYYLSETTAPKGYELNTETIEFEVLNGKAKSTVVMYNSPSKVRVADTLFNKNIITYVVGGVLIIAGAGVLVYEIKKKKHS